LTRSEVHALFLPQLSSESGSSAMLIIIQHIGQVARGFAMVDPRCDVAGWRLEMPRYPAIQQEAGYG
jgi:hypothetical protein